ncbi:sporulation domain protein [Candidatus Vecturithrix granuli]|uniref:Sporulation domain protein n=1 Tax=Vecturithrix granuli TaxID=1499967 RepID=A0A0S6W9C6_VECG1|nr:sporulation domain protein [Candidatus Vecturithrix granuli]
MRRSSSFLVIVGIMLWNVALTLPAYSKTGSVAELSEGAWASHKVNLLQLDGASGDVQSDQNGWIYLGANHLDGGDVTYNVAVGSLRRDDIIEIWIDGYSTSNDLNIGPTVFIGKGKNRFEKITRMSGDAWRPFVFRFADEDLYGDVTDPSNRNQYWRIRYPSSKYEVRRIDKAPHELLEGQILPIRISVTGAEDFIIKRIEVVVMSTQQQFNDGLYIVNLDPYKVTRGKMVTLQLNRELPSEQVDFYIVDPSGREHTIVPQVLNAERNKVGFYIDEFPFTKSGRYEVKLIDRSNRDQAYSDVERFEVVIAYPRYKPKPTVPSMPSVPCPPAEVASIPQAPPMYIVPEIPGQPVVMPPFTTMPPTAPPPAMVPYGVADPTYSAGYTIQIGAFRARSSALAMVDQLRAYGFDAYISESFRGSDCLFRVRVGKYASKSLAQQDASRLRSRGFETWITSLS